MCVSRLLVAASVCCQLACARPAAPEAVSPQPSPDVEIVGVPESIAAKLRRMLASVRAESPNSIAEAIRTMWKSGLVEDVRAFKSDSRVRFVVVPRPVVSRWRVVDEHGKDIGFAAGQLPENAPLDRAELGRVRKRFEELAWRRGFYTAEARVIVEPLDAGTVMATIRLTLGHKANLLGLDVRGNRAIAAGELRGWLPKKGTIFRRAELDRALVVAQAAYYDRGYIDVRVHDPVITYDAARGGVQVAIRIEEGPRFRYGSLTVSGQLKGGIASYLGKVKSKSGQVFNRSRLGEDIKRLAAHQRSLGDSTPSVTPKTRIDKDNRLISVDFAID